ncbi:hypothetical protein CASFOL_008729 [Castilleja foliolosa]|uniref:Uncharacterized protein n=1 Tax=Castilleja foliolosa TaxID=1961234 RepID=A0ABD3E0Y5_9LAMI
MAMPAADADGFQPNTICFTDDTYSIAKGVRGNDNGIFHYKNRTFQHCYYPCDYQSLRRKILHASTIVVARKQETTIIMC